ncbi:glycosyltransferase family 2 protein [Pontibacterium sp. N1Y112]|uniref:Glycosyltransferase family 2 protein n=1 Tax=Pontibacterium sinense TaxID=2781979 RepID=A0A8J7FGQ1_9GAMM|nr:glycosyltransferase [Pontibacterium sinense]MBE9395668.1 glycosyltransferase family 2 protein [Pontibacterium sinense]
MKGVLFLAFIALLAGLSIFSVIELHSLYFAMHSFIGELGVVMLLIFTLLITLRYLGLMLFSMLNNIRRTARRHKPNRDYPKVSIIVPAYNEDVVIQKSLISIMEQTYPRLEIIVVDDGSADATFVKAKQLEYDNGVSSLKVLRKPNGGKAKALNYGMEHSSGELIMVVDADSKLSDDAIERMVPYFDDIRVAAVAGSVYVSNRINTLTRLQALEYIEGLNMARNGQAFFKLVSIIPGPIGVFRKTALQEVGGYDSDTFAEDADLTLKLIAAGYRIDFEPEAFAYTEAPDSLLDLLKQRYRWTRGILQSLAKHKSMMLHVMRRPKISLVLWYMFFESILWPFMDVLGALFFIYVSYTSGTSAFIFYWWLLFTLLDLAGALYCVLTTRESLSLTWYAIFYRLYFISVINVSKIFATIEEWMNLKMDWGKLNRKGNL